MRGLLRSGVLLLAMGVSSLAWAAAPTPQSIADIQRLLGIDVLLEHVMSTTLEGIDQFKTLPSDQRTCLFAALRDQVAIATSRDTGETFRDEETIAAWMKFSTTPGGSKMTQALRATMTEPATGIPAPDMAAVQAAMNPGEKVDVFVFENSPAAEVLKRKFPGTQPVDRAEIIRAVDRCGIVPGKS